MCEDRASLNIQVFQYGDRPHRKRIEGKNMESVIDEGKEFLENVRRKYK